MLLLSTTRQLGGQSVNSTVDVSASPNYRFWRHRRKRFRLLRQTSVRPSVCPSDTLVNPAKAVGRNEMPFGIDTPVVPSNIVLDRGPVPNGKERCEGRKLGTASSQQCHLSPIYCGPCLSRNFLNNNIFFAIIGAGIGFVSRESFVFGSYHSYLEK